MLCPAEFLNGKVRASCCFESMAHERCRTLWAIGGHVFLRESELRCRRNIRKHRRSGEGTIEVKNKVTSCGPLTRGVPLSCGLSFNKLIDNLFVSLLGQTIQNLLEIMLFKEFGMCAHQLLFHLGRIRIIEGELLGHLHNGFFIPALIPTVCLEVMSLMTSSCG